MWLDAADLRGASPSANPARGFGTMPWMGDAERPILLVDVDGVLALFNLAGDPPAGVWHLIEGFPYYLATATADLLHRAAERFELVWCTGWEDRANDHLPRLLGTPGPLPVVYFDRNPGRGNAHWKLAAIDAYAAGRAVAWIDDALNDECQVWAADRTAAGVPTLLVQTEPHRGFEPAHLEALVAFATAMHP